MKKFFSLIALVGVLAACQKEDLKTAFTVEPAVATITAHAMFVDGSPLTQNLSFTFDGNDSGNQNTATFSGNQYQSLTKDITVGVKWAGFDGKRNFADSKVVKVDVLAGGKANYDVYFVLGTITDEDGYEYWVETEDTVLDPKTYWLDKAMHEGHEYVDETYGSGWYIKNASEFILRGTVDYARKEGTDTVSEISWCFTETRVDQFQSLYDSLTDKIVETPETLDIVVSAWEAYAVCQVVTETMTDYTLYRKDLNGAMDVCGSFTGYAVTSTEAQFISFACPGHEAHWTPGHGVDDPAHSHGHGSSNAGGGIVIAD